MTDLEKMRQWLTAFPGWGNGGCSIDYTECYPGCAGLYPDGLEERSRIQDVLGNVTVRLRYHFTL